MRATGDRRRELERRRRRRVRHSDGADDGKRRRSVNVFDPNMEKVARLYKTGRNAFLEVTADGDVRTTSNRSSVYCTSGAACIHDAIVGALVGATFAPAVASFKQNVQLSHPPIMQISPLC